MSEVDTLITHIQHNLDLKNARLSDEYYYSSMALCVIDAVFSIGVTYTSTRNTVMRFCNHFQINRIGRPLETSKEFSIADLLAKYQQHGIPIMTTIYNNKQRTSTRGGILKSEAVLHFAEALQKCGANSLKDIELVMGKEKFEQQIQVIPGQGSGISLRYFYMLAGSDDHVKPDRMLIRFVEKAIGRQLSIEQTEKLVIDACKQLKMTYPHLTPRLLDHLIWNYQRTQ
jgi:hypothetical protein